MSEYIIEIPDYTSPFDPVARAVSLGEEIVRCKDCKHGRSPQQGLPWMCIRNCCAHFPIDSDGFCKWGERRADHD